MNTDSQETQNYDKKEENFIHENKEKKEDLIDETKKEENISNKNKEKKNSKLKGIIFHIVAIICISLFCAAISPKTLQNDTFYTITIGKYIFNNGCSDLTKDLYSIHNLPYTYPHWLYDLGMYVIYHNSGQFGIYLSTIILSAILGISVYTLCNKKSKNKVISFVVTIGAMYLIKSFIAARAQLVTFILFVWTIFAIEKFLETKKKRYAILLIIIPLLIANLHCAVWPFYFVLFLPYIGEYVLVSLEDLNIWFRIKKLFLNIKKKFTKKEENKAKIEEKIKQITAIKDERNRKVKKLRKNPYRIKVEKNHAVLLLIAIMGVAFFTGFLNPAGDGAFTYLYKTMKGNTTSSINEHLPLTLVENTEFSFTVVIFLLFLIFTDTKIKLHDLFMLGGITYLSFKTRRQVSMFAILCSPILACIVTYVFEKYDKETILKIERFISGWFGTIVIICLFVIWCTNIVKPTLKDDYIDTSSYPVEASDWILENLDVKNIRLFNEYNYGSYLLYRGIPVFIDSRCDLYSPEFNGTYNEETKKYDGRDIFSDALNIAGVVKNYEEKFEEYKVTHIILYQNSKLAMILEEDSNYKEIYNKGNFKIFERLSAEKVEN